MRHCRVGPRVVRCRLPIRYFVVAECERRSPAAILAMQSMSERARERQRERREWSRVETEEGAEKSEQSKTVVASALGWAPGAGDMVLGSGALRWRWLPGVAAGPRRDGVQSFGSGDAVSR